MTERLVLALDGHDGAGKTTIASALALRLGGVAVRPFAGATGGALFEAGQREDVDALIEIGGAAIETAVSTAPKGCLVVLDRAWMTVASFMPGVRGFLFAMAILGAYGALLDTAGGNTVAVSLSR